MTEEINNYIVIGDKGFSYCSCRYVWDKNLIGLAYNYYGEEQEVHRTNEEYFVVGDETLKLMKLLYE